ATDGTGVINMDPWLEPYRDHLKSRYSKAVDWIKKIEKYEGGLDQFSKVLISFSTIVLGAILTWMQGYEKYGLNVKPNGDIVYREWAPGVVSASLIGEFSMWRSMSSYGIKWLTR